METKTLLNASLHALIKEFQSHVKLGWVVTDADFAGTHMHLYEISMRRDDNTIKAVLDLQPETAKMSREDVLIKARVALKKARDDKRSAKEKQGE